MYNMCSVLWTILSDLSKGMNGLIVRNE